MMRAVEGRSFEQELRAGARVSGCWVMGLAQLSCDFAEERPVHGTAIG